MSLASGTKLGVYEILSPLGAGDMGEVYRARDTEHARDVTLMMRSRSLGCGYRSAGRLMSAANGRLAMAIAPQMGRLGFSPWQNVKI